MAAETKRSKRRMTATAAIRSTDLLSAFGHACRVRGNYIDDQVDKMRPELREMQLLRAWFMWDMADAVQIALDSLEADNAELSDSRPL